MAGKLRVAVIGSQTRHPDTPLAYTVYRTSVNYQGLCYQRLIRYRQFRYFAKHLKLGQNSARITAKFPPKIWWSRKGSLRPETVEVRQVLLNEFMQQVCTRSLTAHSKERLLKMLQVDKYAPQDEKGRVIDSRLGSEQQSVTVREHTSDEQDHNHFYCVRNDEMSIKDEEERSESSCSEKNESRTAMQVRSDTDECTEQILFPPNSTSSVDSGMQQNRFVPTSLPPKSPNAKCVMFRASGEAGGPSTSKEGDGNSISSSSDSLSSPERYYLDRIKQHMASIENIVDRDCSVDLRGMSTGKLSRRE
ncbi:unnamed protein product [Hyaloperonospora brassicae]|uniref:PX domain-containing protein n=1 Tax=Hyaloperonospora brassicae TaxID=162125 RepID=A0AAV0UUL0_HYABA|nr:unnamed protein product [Hyaloperonospora brassicae]